jgi:hypothetical protein
MRPISAALLLVSPGALCLGLVLVARGAGPAPSPGVVPEDITEVVERAPATAPASATNDLDSRVVAALRAHPDAAVVTCPLAGRLRFAVMPLHVHLDRPGDPPPLDYAVVEDTLLLTVPPGGGGANLRTGDDAGLGRLGWPEVDAGHVVACAGFTWTQGPLRVPGLVRGARPDALVVRACGEDGATFPVGRDGGFTLVLARSAEVCRLRLEAGSRRGPWREVRADRLDGTVWLDVPAW